MNWKSVLVALTVTASFVHAARADDVLDINKLDATALKELLGPYDIQDQAGKKHCRVVLKQDAMIGGYQIDVGPKCPRVFPVMDDIAAWRLLEGFQIVLVDALRHGRIRFYTPDNRYVAEPETDGIFTIVKLKR